MPKILDAVSVKYLMDFPGVVAVGYGYKTTDGVRTGEKGIVVSVKQKVPASWLNRGRIIPAEILGMKTDVVGTGVLKTLETTGKYRPAPGGVSIGHKDITAGTLGCLVKKVDGSIYILSNNHVLANSNAGIQGDAIYQPGPHDGGTSEDQIAVLDDFVEVTFTEGIPNCPIPMGIVSIYNFLSRITGRSHRLSAIKIQEGGNLVDAAIAGPVKLGDDVIDELITIGQIAGQRDAVLGDKLQKDGRTTDHTEDEVTQVEVTANVQYGEGKIATFEDQLMAGPMSAGGDSGSAVLDMDKNIVGLLFAGSEQVTIINNIKHVFELLNVTLL